MKTDLLLHHCCAPCSVKLLEKLQEKFNVRGFWFNPNIHPSEENTKRKESLIILDLNSNVTLHYGAEYSQELWIENAKQKGSDRCRFCYTLRLKETAKKAKALGFKYFSTSLLASPYQKHDLIKETALQCASEENIDFYYEDFRPFFYESKTKARKLGFYMQKYCGCIFSKQARDKKND